MCYLYPGRSSYCIWFYAEAMVLRGDFALAAYYVFNRVIQAAVAVVHFKSWDIVCECQQLVAEANAKQGYVCRQNLFYCFNCIIHRGRVAGAIANEIAVGVKCL